MEFRIKGAMGRQNLNRHDAIEFIRKGEAKRAKWAKFLYHVDWHDPSLYDIVISLDRIGLPSACELVCGTAGLEEFQATPESQKRLEELVLSTEVRARIAADGSIKDDSIEIEAHEGVVIIGGSVHSLEDADRVRELVRGMPGVKDVESHLRAPIQTRIRL